MTSAPADCATNAHLPHIATLEAPRLPGDAHARHLAADDVGIAEHEGHDRHHLGGQVRPFDAEQQSPGLGGRRQQDRRDDSEAGLGEDVPRAEQPWLADRDAQHVDPVAP
jgi:hypothetical protein